METKHTPGPWDVSKLTSPDYAPEYVVCADASARWHAVVKGEANARLIAAAPELLAALRRLMPLWDREDVADTWSEDFEAAEAAIAKAEGTQ